MNKFQLKDTWGLIVQTFYEFIDDKALKMSAALSYYASFSLGPLLIIIVSVAGFIFGDEAARGEIFKQINYLIGNDGAQMVETILKGASDKPTGIIATLLSLVFLLLGAIGIFVELQESLNVIWGVELRPGRGIWGFVKTRLVSFSMIVATGFLLMISLLINTAISLFSSYLSGVFEGLPELAQVFNVLSSFIVIALLFALIFKYLPDVMISWRYVWLGAFITSALFTLGKFLIGLYLGNSSYSSTYGAAASLVILFIWIYYSGVILFFGAEFTQVFRKRYGSVPLKADSDGIIIPKVSQLVKELTEESDKEVKQ
ncbi:MAG: YihY/virulence factor BrkB family protein [bacterium]